tara:strand:- start:12413 stop:13771 length:1359 start_codon:yes stop_codon:yes gene_type:complete
MILNKTKKSYQLRGIEQYNMNKITIFFFTFFCGLIQISNAEVSYSNIDDESIDTRNRIHKEYIKTLQVRNAEAYPSYPIISLNSNDFLSYSFDDLSNLDEDYVIQVFHCTYDWKISDLQSNEYLRGFPELPVTEFEPSFNSAIPYVNYQFDFPNDMMIPLVSGNYIIQVAPDDDLDNPIFTSRIIIYEQLIRYRAQLKESSIISNRNSHQELDFELVYNGYEVFRPYDDIENVVLQNFNWDNSISDLEPVFVKNNEISYDYGEENNFTGNNEYRFFSTANISGISSSMHSLKINAKTLVPEIELNHDAFRPYKLYTTFPDINGDFKVNSLLGFNDDLEAEYCQVTFVLNKKTPMSNDQKIHVLGGFNFNQLTSESQMQYNYTLKRYELTTLLKQGYYNYTYALVEDGQLDLSFVEGSHFQTENDFHIFTYDTNPNLGYDRVIGMYKTDTFNN